MQEIDAARRAAILRGETPPPLPEEETHKDERRRSDRNNGHDRKRRKLAGEDDTDRDIRLAASLRGGDGDKGDDDTQIVKLRKPAIDAPLTDHAGNINLFPVDLKEQIKRQKNEDAEKEKRKKERALEDQYTMRLSNAAGRSGLEQPWYASNSSKTAVDRPADDNSIAYPGLENKDVWGNEDPRRQDREKSRITSSDPFAFMQRAQVQLKKSKDDKKKWAEERERELMELRAAQERSSRREKHGKRKKYADEDDGRGGSLDRDDREKGRSSSRRHRHRSRSRSRERRHHRSSSHRHERKRSRSRSRDRNRNNGDRAVSPPTRERGHRAREDSRNGSR